jgi:nanoRNase/pAp phosphatase (c-di-AMP/oligoRNAs hydrolase)
LVITDSQYEALKRLISGRTLILSHHNADPDAIGSAFALQQLVSSLKQSASADIYLPGGATLLSKKIMDELGITVLDEASIDDYELLLIPDTATLRQLEAWGDVVSSAEISKIFVDHHSPHPEVSKISSLHLLDEGASSTCEIVYAIYRKYGIAPSSTAARALMLGILFDSKHLRLATSRTIQYVSELLQIDGSMEEIFVLLVNKRERPENIARLKAAQRMKLHMIGDWTIATSQLSSYQSSAARALIGLGGDVALVTGRSKKTLKASFRSSEGFHDKTHVHLGRGLAMPLGEMFSGAGSGHPTAAGFNGEGDPREFLKEALCLLAELLEKE